jgi:hypothetical protein
MYGSTFGQCNPATSSFNGKVTKVDGTPTGSYNVTLRHFGSPATPNRPAVSPNGISYNTPNCTPSFQIGCPFSGDFPTIDPIPYLTGTYQVKNGAVDGSCGVSVLDLFIFRKHLWNLAPLDQYAYFAVDVNRNGSPDEDDYYQMQSMITGNITSFSNVAHWEYFPSFFTPTIMNPGQLVPTVHWSATSPQITSYGVFVQTSSFFGIKMGDLNHDCHCQAAKPSDLLVNEEKIFIKSDDLSSSLFAPNRLGIQASFIINPGIKIDDLEIEYNINLGMDEYSIRKDYKSNSLVVVYTSQNNTPSDESDWLIRVKKPIADQPVFVGLNQEFKNLLVTKDMKEVPFSLSHTNMVQQIAQKLQVWPTLTNTIVRFEPPVCNQYPRQILLTDLIGKVTQSHVFEPNHVNEIDISALPCGVYTISGLFDGKTLVSKFTKY